MKKPVLGTGAVASDMDWKKFNNDRWKHVLFISLRIDTPALRTHAACQFSNSLVCVQEEALHFSKVYH
jgi:hypothetical protein